MQKIDLSNTKVGLPPNHAGEYVFRTQFCETHYVDHTASGGNPKRWDLQREEGDCDVLGCESKVTRKEKTDFGGGKSLRGIRVNG